MLMTAQREEVPPTEVSPKAQRRRFTAEYKLRIVREADACKEPGEVGALVRREGIYYSYLTEWRSARERGELAALSPKTRGPKTRQKDERDERIQQQEKELKQLRARAERAEAIVEIQKKISQMLGLTLPTEEGSV